MNVCKKVAADSELYFIVSEIINQFDPNFANVEITSMRYFQKRHMMFISFKELAFCLVQNRHHKHNRVYFVLHMSPKNYKIQFYCHNNACVKSLLGAPIAKEIPDELQMKACKLLKSGNSFCE